MKYLGRFQHLHKKNIFAGEYDNESGLVTPIESIIYPFKTGSSYKINELEILCPVKPTKIIAIGKNYKAHIEEFDSETPSEPLIFFKALSSLNDPDKEIILPSISERVEYEGEIAIVIKKECYKIKEENVMDYILGFTCANDITARDIQRRDGQWARGKSFNTFCPIGPWILQKKDISNYNDLLLNTYLNGNIVQSAKAELMIFKIPKLISYISQAMTLYAEDVILTGTPSGVGDLKNNNCVEVEIQQIGKLKNKIACE